MVRAMLGMTVVSFESVFGVNRRQARYAAHREPQQISNGDVYILGRHQEAP
jgi:hypothetical protein